MDEVLQFNISMELNPNMSYFLTDDCLLHIFNFLTFPDQVSILQTCSRFQQLIQYIWKRSYKTITLDFCGWQITNSDLIAICENLQESVEVLRLKFLSREIFSVISKFIFPKVHDFRFYQHPAFMKNEDFMAFPYMFPNLVTYSPHGFCEPEHIKLMKKLENVTLTYCKGISYNFLKNILKSCPIKTLKLDCIFDYSNFSSQLINLKTLEKLELSSYELTLLFWRKKSFCNLKELILTDSTFRELSLNMQEFTMTNIRSMEISNVNDSYPFEKWLKYAKNCETLKLTNFGHLNLLQLPRYLGMLPQLRELFINAMHMETNHIYDYLSAAPSLEYLSLERCSFDSSKLVINAHNSHKLLTINECDNTCNGEAFNCLVIGPGAHLVKVTNKKHTDFTYDHLHVTFY